MCSVPCGRVGYWLSEKKGKKFNLVEMADVFRAAGFELIKIDLRKPLEEQGPFDAIVHKISDIVVKADAGDEESKQICKAFQDYVDNHPNLIVIDILANVRKLLDRYKQYKLVAESELCQKEFVFIPPFVELTTKNVSVNLEKMKAAGVDFPIVCKPTLAHGAPISHQMSLIFNKEGLKDISPPCVVQKIINHNAVLYKLLIIGDKYFIIERPSLKNLYASDQKTIFFDSNDISKPHSACELTELDANEPYSPAVFPEKEAMDKIVEILHDIIGLNLLNIDVIVDNKGGRYAIVDINVFPGYPEVQNFYDLLCELVVRKIQFRLTGDPEPPFKPVLLNCLSSPVIAMKRDQKFSFDLQDNHAQNSFNNIHMPKCFCCPISGSSCNSVNHMPKSTTNKFAGDQTVLFSKPNNEFTMIQKHNGAQDDSGIETSDSCDEKKSEARCRAIKHQHSKNTIHNCAIVSESDQLIDSIYYGK
ncbi:inositol-tetrakisphosphate 1-kinase [Parasteatoda tepidariorum]|uniref:inositol-tetrakisphosphate 1-kinase n=1 Tax=Parasteatoda tepidariorum TaxID=114398 RepID=UPI00077F9108|nr:inositol-tetrakisphosphate 1-kinase [Parasteatoda tepidariorum]